jgi:heme exporter protein C
MDNTGSKGTRVLGLVALAGAGLLAALGLFISPEDTQQGDQVRLMYIHVPSAITAYVAFATTAVGSIMWLWKKSRWWDLVAASAAEIGVVFTALCLISGSLWGRNTWGTYWEWDPRITATTLLLLMFMGYLAVRRLPADVTTRNTRSAVVGLVAFADVPVVHYAVDWWRSLHQGSTISNPLDVKIAGLQLLSLMVGMVTFLVIFAWLIVHRFRLAWLDDRAEELWLDAAVSERRLEAEVT